MSFISKTLLTILLLLGACELARAQQPVTVTNSFLLDATLTGRFAAAFASADAIAAQTSTFVHGGMMGWNASTSKWDRLRLDTSDNLNVNLSANSFGNLTVLGSGNFTVVQGTGTNLHTVLDSGTLTTLSTLTNITNNNPSGSVAHDGVGTGVNPLLVGCYASAAAPTDVSNDGDATRAWCLRNGAYSVNLSTAGTLYDARQIRALASGTDTVTITDGAGALNVIIDSGSTVVTQGTGTNLHTVLDSGTLTTLTTLTGITNALPTGSNTIGAVTGTSANNSANSSLKLPTLPAVANAANPSWTETNQVPLSVDLAGNLRVNSTGGGVTDNSAFTAGSSSEVTAGLVYNDTLAILNAGVTAAQRGTAYRSAYSTLQGTNGLEQGTVTNPLLASLTGVTGFFGGSTLQDPNQTQIATLDPFGRLQSVSTISDGSGRYAAMRGAEGAQLNDAGIVTSPSIAPALQCPYVQAFSQVASATVVTNPGGKALHICWFSVVSSTAQSFSLAEGTGNVCATGIKALYGSTAGSAALAANGGLHAISDRITLPMQVAGDNLCVVQSSSGNMSGTIVYGIY